MLSRKQSENNLETGKSWLIPEFLHLFLSLIEKLDTHTHANTYTTHQR